MKRSILSVLLCVIFITFTSCSKNNSYSDALSKKISDNLSKDLYLYNKIVIIPGSGCDGCITDAEYFFKNNYENEKIMFIFTFVASKKILRLFIGKDNIKRKNIFTDDDNIFYLNDYDEKNYPYLINIDNGKIVGINVFNP